MVQVSGGASSTHPTPTTMRTPLWVESRTTSATRTAEYNGADEKCARLVGLTVLFGCSTED